MPTKYDPDEHGKIRPDREDYDAVKDESDDPQKTRLANDAHKYRLAVAHKLIRLYGL